MWVPVREVREEGQQQKKNPIAPAVMAVVVRRLQSVDSEVGLLLVR